MAPNSGISITGVFLRFYESLVERTEIGYISADDRQWRAFLLQQTLRFGPAGSRTLSGYLLEQQEYGVLLSLVRPAAWHCRSLPREDAMAALRLAVRAAFAVEGEESEEGDALAEMMMMMAMDDCLLDLIGIAYEFHCPRRFFSRHLPLEHAQKWCELFLDRNAVSSEASRVRSIVRTFFPSHSALPRVSPFPPTLPRSCRSSHHGNARGRFPPSAAHRHLLRPRRVSRDYPPRLPRSLLFPPSPLVAETPARTCLRRRLPHPRHKFPRFPRCRGFPRHRRTAELATSPANAAAPPPPERNRLLPAGRNPCAATTAVGGTSATAGESPAGIALGV